MKRLCLLWTVGVAQLAGAQQDSLRTIALDPVVVSAERRATPRSMTAASITTLSGEDLRRVRGPTLADALRLVPGFAVVDFDGLGGDPQVMTRGFYGGGEAEYVVVLVDGKAVNQLHTGRVAWDALPRPEAIATVEVLRGSSSPAWGDAALGGVISIVTTDGAARPAARWMLGGGTHGVLQSSVDGTGLAFGRRVWGSVSADRASGFRDHSRRLAAGARAGTMLVEGSRGSLSLGLLTHHRSFDEPGALLGTLAATDRSSSDPVFRFDETSDLRSSLSVDAARQLSRAFHMRATLTGELRDVDATRTLALAPGFGDTRARDAAMLRGGLSAQLEFVDEPRQAQLVVGGELSGGALDSRYFEVMTGTREEYVLATGNRGALSARGDASRTTGALFLQYARQLSAPVRLSLGARADWLRDLHTAKTPPDGDVRASHAALSPRIGINVRYLESGTSSGHLFAVVSHSFKAPTLDQLFDQRPIPVPFPPFTLTTANSGLSPQRGLGGEAGLQHSVLLDAGGTFSGTLGVYQMDMRDELDFDLATFRYVNIGRSRHRGVEGGARWSDNRWSMFTNYTLQVASSRAGPNAGKSLKAIPRQALSGGMGFSPARLPALHLTATHARDIFLDDANAVALPSWTRVDAQLTQRVAALVLTLQVRNAFGARHSTTGFPDPSGSGQIYYHPAAGRTLQLGIRSGG